MKNFTLIITTLVLFFCVGITTNGFAQKPEEKPPKMYINSPDVESTYVSVSFEITYGGFVELHLFDKDGKKVWIKGKVCDMIGEHAIKIGRKPLKEGERYSIKMKYKGKDYESSFYN